MFIILDELKREMIIPTKKKMEKPQINKSKGTENKGPCLENTKTEKVDKIEITQEDELEEEVMYWNSITHVNVIFLLSFFLLHHCILC